MQLPVTLGTSVEQRETREVLGIICRDGTYDDFVAKEIEPTYGWMNCQDEVVLDIGGNIGAFARWAALHGAHRVVTIEPEDSNFECLLANTRDQEAVQAIRGAVGTEDGTTEIWLSPTGKNPGNTSSVKYRGRVSQGSIPALAFSRILEQNEPGVVKIDVEGAEYGFLTAPLPDFVRQCTIEIHLSRPEWRQKLGPQIASFFDGWETVRAPKFEGGHWQTIGAWKR
jgi:FkbM family methyltransferase